MEAISSYRPDPLPLHQPHREDVRAQERVEPGSRAVTAAASSSASRSLSLSIVTAEGDTVTLSAASTTGVGWTAFAGTSTGSDGTLAAQARGVTVSSAASVALTVEGELSREETRDITKAVRAYESALKHLVNGRPQAAHSHLAQIARLDEIAGFAATYSLATSLSVAVREVSETAPAPPSPEAAAA